MLKDKVLIGIAVGILADIVKLTINYISFQLNFTNVVFWQITATRFLNKDDLFKPAAYLIGGITDFTITAAIGIFFIYFIYLTSKVGLWIKGVGFGMTIWVGLFGTVLGQSVQDKLPQTPAGILVTLVAHFFFGISLALFTRIFYIFDENPQKERKGFYRFVTVPAKKIAHYNVKKEDKPHKTVKLKKPIKL